MLVSTLRLGWIPVLAVTLAAAAPVNAQFTTLDLRYRLGLVTPTGDFGEFFTTGPTFGIDARYPLLERAGVLVSFDVEQINNGYIYIPDTRRLRYQAGVEADLLPGTFGPLRLAGFASAGASSLRSKEFPIGGPPARFEKLSTTTATATGGLRLGLRSDGGYTWWVSGAFNWGSFADEDVELLRTASLDALDPFSAATDLTFTVGLTLRN